MAHIFLNLAGNIQSFRYFLTKVCYGYSRTEVKFYSSLQSSSKINDRGRAGGTALE